MKTLAATLVLAVTAILCGCQSGFAPQPLLQKTIVFAYDDFGPESLTSSWLGPRSPGARVVVHYTQSESALRQKHPGPEHHFVGVRAAIFHTGRTLRQLPEATPERARVRATFTTLRTFEQDRRNALNASPPFAGRGSTRRMGLTH